MDMLLSDYRGIPHELRSAASEWEGGLDSPLYLFWWGQPVNAEKLLKEVRECIRICESGSGKWLPKLQAIESIALGHVTKAKAVAKLRKALMECAVAGADLRHVDDWRREAERIAAELRDRQAAGADEDLRASVPGRP